MSFTRVNILKVIVLVGTFALAMAFAANDLVNFIGVPLAGLTAYTEAGATADPLTATMEALAQPVRSNTIFLLIAGVIMVVTLWLSRKARTVTKTEVRLGRQEEGYETIRVDRPVAGRRPARVDGLRRPAGGWRPAAIRAMDRTAGSTGRSSARHRPPTAPCRPSTSSAPRST